MTTTETLTKTVILPLETSNRKNERLQHAIDEWQSIAKTVADYHASFPDYEWGRTKQNPSWYRIVSREHGDSDLHSQGTLAALHKVGSSFESWRENGKAGKPPQFGTGNYCRFTDSGVELVQNESGYGLKVKLEPYNAEWWHIDASKYHREYCQRLVDNELKLGSVELHYDPDSETVSAHAAVSQDIAVTEWSDVETVIGVDLGENTLYASVAVSGDTVDCVEIESGREYRHYRERLKDERYKLQEQGELREAYSARTRYEEYTDYITHVASREIVSMADEYENSGIAIEKLAGYRESGEDRIHDWPYREIQKKICYKATEAGIPVTTVEPAYTSQTCRKCGESDQASRDGTHFQCHECGYEVHADVNAAINIAQRAV